MVLLASSSSPGSASPEVDPMTSARNLASMVDAAIIRKEPGLRHDLERILRKHKPQCIALLKNPVCSVYKLTLVHH